jgi:hypothetical protein
MTKHQESYFARLVGETEELCSLEPISHRFGAGAGVNYPIASDVLKAGHLKDRRGVSMRGAGPKYAI